MNENLTWLKETIPYLPTGNWLYKVMCFVLFRRKRKFNYGEYYLILSAFHKKKLGEEEAQKKALNSIMSLYAHFHNNKYPNFDNNDK